MATYKNIERTNMGLRNMLFDELDSLRKGESDYQRASAVSKLTVQILNSAKLDYEINTGLSKRVPFNCDNTIKLGS